MPSARSISVCMALTVALRLAAASTDPGVGCEGTPPLRVFTARDTGVPTMAWSAAQDQDGRMYFGCDTVVSFDGDRWHPENVDPTAFVRGLDVGPNGRIWVAATNQIGYLEPAARGVLEYHSLVDRLTEGTPSLGDVWRAYALGDDAAVFVAHDRVLRWDGQKFTTWPFPGMHLLWSTRTAKGIYVDYPPLGLLKMGPDGPAVAVPASVIGPSAVGWIDDSGPDWLLLTPQGLKVLHDGACTPLRSAASTFIQSNTATCALRLKNGTLAVGTLKGGIALFGHTGEVLRIFNHGTGLPSNQVYSLFVDRDGALWGMGPAHIFRLGMNSGTALYDERSGYPAGGAYSLDASSGSIVISSHNDAFRLDPSPDSGGAGRFDALGLTSGRVYSILSVARGVAVSDLQGLGLLDRGARRPLGSISEGVLRTGLSRARPGWILASLIDRVVSVDPATGETLVVASGLPDYGETVVDDSSGRVWIGTPSRGIFVAEPGDTRAVPAGPRFGSLPPAGTAYVTMAGDAVVVLTSAGGFVLDPSSRRFQRIENLPVGIPSAVSNADGAGAVWAALYPDSGGHSSRIGRISVSGGVATWSPRSLEGNASLGSILGLRVIGAGEHEELWISGTEGLLRARHAALLPQPPPKKPQVRAWVMADTPAGRAPVAGVLPYSTRGVHIEYASLDYGMRDSEGFQTLLGGAENEWSPATDSAERDISGLREGGYDFRVRLVTDSGEAGSVAQLRFGIAPPWWRTPLARAAFALAAVLGAAGLLRLRTRALKRRAEALEGMVRKRTEELEKANAAKTEFVASMSHEIRNPMGGILSSATELAETPLEPGQQRLVTTLQSCAVFLASLVEDVLDYAAIEAGAYAMTRSSFRPRDILDTVVTMLEPRAAEGCMGVAVDPDLPEHLVGDAARIQQVMVNFAANSLKFGGKSVWLSARTDGDQVMFTVADDGVGVPADEQKNLFIRFSRLKSARTAAIPGSGLGLAVCRALAYRMGGSVGFAPAPGGGSIFHLRIPLLAAPVPEAAPSPDGKGRRVLVVEDIDYNARALGLMLGRLGFDVTLAADGEQALACLARESFHAVFLDCDLPLMGGIEVARRLRASESTGSRTLVVATTALSGAHERSACIAAGMDAFLSKPITPAKLRAALAGADAGDATGSQEASPRMGNGPGIDLGLLAHLADGSVGSLERELEKFIASLEAALCGVREAHRAGSRPAVSSAAHRVLSLARMIGADALAAPAADIQDFASAFTEAELAGEIGILVGRASSLTGELRDRAERSSLSPFRAS